MLNGTVILLETVHSGMVHFEDKDVNVSKSDDSDGVKFICPYCEDYAGRMDSVRGHIRAKTDSAHKGKSGFETDTEPEAKPVDKHGSANASVSDSGGNGSRSNGSEDEPGVALAIIAGLVGLAWWVARKTGNEDRVRDQAVRDWDSNR